MTTKFYVYAYCRKNGSFYYIGKGSGKRAYKRGKKEIKPPSDLSRILILHTDLSEKTAFEYEQKLILFYGRKDLGTGLLRNKTEGGDGPSGWIPSEEWKIRQSERMKREGSPFKSASPQELRQNGRKGGEKCRDYKLGMFARDPEKIKEDASKAGERGGNTQRDLGLGFFARSREERKEDCRKGGERAGSMRWEDPDHPELGIKNAGTLASMQKARGFPHGPENRRRVL